jgi:hypothetical protein
MYRINKSSKRFAIGNDAFDSFDDVSLVRKKMGLFGGGGKSGGGGGGTQTVTQQSEPWKKQIPYLETGFNALKQNFIDHMPLFFPNSTVVPFADETNRAMELQKQRALDGSPINGAATDQLTGTMRGDELDKIWGLLNNPIQQSVNDSLLPTLRGDYLYGGDAFNAAFNAASNKILPQVNSAFEKSGRRRSGLADVAKTQALSDAFAGQYGQERQNMLQAAGLGQQLTDTYMNSRSQERDRQINAMSLAPQIASLDYQDIQKLAQVGAQKEALQQEYLSDQIARWDYNQNLHRNSVLQYMGAIQGNYGGTSTQTSSMSGGGGGGGLLGGLGSNLIGGFGGMMMAPSLGIPKATGFALGLGG